MGPSLFSTGNTHTCIIQSPLLSRASTTSMWARRTCWFFQTLLIHNSLLKCASPGSSNSVAFSLKILMISSLQDISRSHMMLLCDILHHVLEQTRGKVKTYLCFFCHAVITFSTNLFLVLVHISIKLVVVAAAWNTLGNHLSTT